MFKPTILLTQIVLLALLTTCKKTNEPATIAVDKSFKHVSKLRGKYQPIPQSFKFEANENTNIKTRKNTVIRIPAGSFQGDDTVQLKVTESVTSVQAFSLGMPLRDTNGRLFRSDGMFRLDTKSRLAGKSAIKVSMVAKSDRPMNVYAWIDEKWVFQGKNQLTPTKSNNIRSFTGVEPNIWYNYDLPIEPEENSCVTITLPQKQKKLFLVVTESEGRSFNEASVVDSNEISIRFLPDVKVDLQLFAPNGLHWEKHRYNMPKAAEKKFNSENCVPLAASFQDIEPQPTLKELTPEEFEQGLERIRKKYGKIARIKTKTGDEYIGYFNQINGIIHIETPQGSVSLFVREVRKVTPMN